MNVMTESRLARELSFESEKFNDRIEELFHASPGSTEPIGYIPVEYSDWWASLASDRDSLATPCNSTEAKEDFADYSSRWASSLRSLVGAVVLAFRPIAEPESSRTVNPFWITVAEQLREQEENLADFFEPAVFTWSKRNKMVRDAVRAFSQQTDANY